MQCKGKRKDADNWLSTLIKSIVLLNKLSVVQQQQPGADEAKDIKMAAVSKRTPEALQLFEKNDDLTTTAIGIHHWIGR